MKQDEVEKAADFISRRLGGTRWRDETPRISLVLGSGLGALADELESPVVVPYRDIPGFPASTAPGHAGRLVAGGLDGRPVFVMQGRFHCYEGYSASLVAFPVRVFKRLGVERLFLTNAAGGANPAFATGDLMLITDHINLTGQNPCIGANNSHIGPRFFDMTHAWDPELCAAARRAAAELGMGLREGVYAWFTGPSFETPAEIRMARTLGADAVGMSTVPEAIAAAHCGLRTLGVSCITNLAAGMSGRPITSEEVLEISEREKPRFTAFVKRTVAIIEDSCAS